MSNSTWKLSERLQAQMQADQQAVIAQTKQLLKLHEQNLKRLSDDALRTTHNAIVKHNQALNDLHSETLKRLQWLMLWPVLSSVALAVVIVSGASLWSWWTVDQAQIHAQIITTQAQTQAAQQQQQMQQALDQFCATPAGQHICTR